MSWSTAKIGKLLKPSGHDRAGSNDYPVLSITMHEGLVDQSSKFKKRIASRDTASYRVVYTNELVVGFPIDEGVLGFQTKYPAGIVSPAYGIWKLALPDETHIPYLEGYLRSGVAREIYASKMRGGVARRRTISKDEFLDIDIPFPPLDEQRRIAAVLDKADALRRQRQESLQLTEKLLQSVFIDMFGDPVSNTKGWPTESLTKACKLSSGGTPSKSNASFWEGDLPWYTPKDLKKDELADSIDHVSADVLSQTNLKLFPAETVLIVVRGMILAHSFPVSVIKKAGVVNQDIKALTPVADLHPQFLAACLRSQRSLILTKVTTAGHGTKKLDTEGLSEIRIFLPPMGLQLKFITLVNRHRELLADGVSSRDSVASLFSSLQQRAFRGELDLSRLKLNAEEMPPGVAHPESAAIQGRYKRPGSFIAPPEIEAHMLELEDKLDYGSGDSIPWNENYFKYRILSQVLRPPFSFNEIWEKVKYDMDEASYETVKDKVFEYVATGILEQQFDEERKEIVFHPRP